MRDPMTELPISDAAMPKRAALALIGMLALVMLPLGCMKAGDGMGLSATGQPLTLCEQNPDHPTCIAADPCIANPSLPQCLDSCQTTPPAPGCSVDVCKLNPDDPSCPPPKVKFAAVMAVIKANTCQECHTGTGAGVTTGKLLLSDDSAYANLVNKPASVQTVAKGWMRVKPFQPDSSILYLKVSKNPPKLPSGTNYGVMMPQGATKLLDTSITNVIKQWILDGAEQ
jgi:hypothetical protein